MKTWCLIGDGIQKHVVRQPTPEGMSFDALALQYAQEADLHAEREAILLPLFLLLRVRGSPANGVRD